MEVTQLTVNERSDLERLEKVVEDNMVSWIKVGLALREIRDRKLYLDTHASWEEYVKARFDVARSTAYQYLDGVQVIDNVKNAGGDVAVLPERESLVRPLTKLESDEQPRAWRLAIIRAKESGARNIFARHVIWAVDSIRGETGGEKLKSKVGNDTGELPENFQAAFKQITEIIYTAKRNQFKGVDKKKMIDILDRLRRMIAG